MAEKQPASISVMMKKFIFAPVIILLSPVLLVILLLYLAWGALLYLAIWLTWSTRGRRVLFVYSDSPVWKEIIEHEVLPKLDENAVILNWSQRKQWKPSLAMLAFEYFGGSRDFNPLALVFRPLRRVKVFRFYRPFRDYKHGNVEGLHEIIKNFLDTLKEGAKD